MNDNKGFSPQREYRNGISLNIWQIIIIGIVSMMILSNSTMSTLPKSLSPYLMVSVFICAVSIVLPSTKNIGHKLIEEVLGEFTYILRGIFVWGIHHV